MTMSESILLAVCFGYVLGDILSKLVVIVSDIVKNIKHRRHTKENK